MHYFLCAFVLFAVWPSSAFADLTLDKLESYREEALAFTPTEPVDEDTRRVLAIRRAVDAELAQIYPEDFAPEIMSDAFRWRQACQSDDWDACTSLGALYATGEGVWRDNDLALSLFWMGCDAGHGAACHSYDETVAASLSALVFPYPAEDFHRGACTDGSAASCQALFSHFITGDRALAMEFGQLACAIDPTLFICGLILSDEERAAQKAVRLGAAREDCEAGDPRACMTRALLEQPPEAFAAFIRACDLGHAPGCESAGYQTSLGRGTPKDGAKARAFYAAACDLSPKNCVRLARAYNDGLGGPVDRDKARAYFQVACDAFADPAHASCKWLAADSFDFLGGEVAALVAEELRPSMATAQQGCRDGDAAACHDLGLLLRGFAENDLLVGAAPLAFNRACELGSAAACFAIASPEYSPNSDHPWDAACAAGYGPACVAILAQGAADQWLPSLEALCDEGMGAACARLGKLHLLGEGQTGRRNQYPQDEALALSFYERACAAGDAEGCGQVGWIVDPKVTREELEPFKRSAADTLALYDESCAMGWDWACSLAIYRVPTTDQLQYAVRSCEAGNCTEFPRLKLQATHAARMDGQAIIFAASSPDYDVFIPDYHGVVRRLGRACQRDAAWACFRLGFMYSGYGEGYELVYESQYAETGIGLMTRACELAGEEYCRNLAWHLPNDTDEDRAKLVSFLEGHCEAGQAWACARRASDLRWETDQAAAHAHYLAKALRLGDLSVQSDLYSSAHELPQSDAEDYLGMICAWYGRRACAELAEAFLKDRPVLQRAVLTIGCDDEDQASCRALSRLN